MRLGEIFIQLKLDISQFKDALLKQKAEVERSAREIESINIASAKKSTSSQLEEYNKFIAEKDRATKKAVAESIRTNDKASAAIMQGNLNYEKYIRQSMSDTLRARTALNQQQLKEIQQIDASILKSKTALNQQQLKLQEQLDSSSLKSKTALNQQQLKEEKAAFTQRQRLSQDYYAADAKAQYQYSQTVQRAATSQMKSWQQMYDAQERFAQKASASQDKNQYNQLTRGIEQARKEYNASLGPQKSYLQNTVAISKQVLLAAPGFAIATGAIAAMYAILRAVRDEFVKGLKAVEDYQVSIASMAAFLTTFDRNINLSNVGEIYAGAKQEATKLVQTMEILDARTVASGRDLTIMAEQFIKGSVKIDTANQGTLDGFTNIANALKLLTQGQNQEIQMRQEIRSLVQGQLRDSNILVKTLQSIDPEIKSHLVTWRQQGVLIEKVGALLVGFGPASKDLQHNWAVIGSTMETIHNRILRDGFKRTYENLISLAEKWNALLMNADGSLTMTSKGISKLISGMLYLVELGGKFVYYFSGLQAWGFLGTLVDKFSQLADKLGLTNKEAEKALQLQAEMEVRKQKSDQIIYGKTETSSTISSEIIPAIEGTLSPSDISEKTTKVKEYLSSLKTKLEELKESTNNSAAAEANAKMITGQFAEDLNSLKDGGYNARNELEKLTAEVNKTAGSIDSLTAQKKLQQLADSLNIKTAALDKSKESEMAATLASKEWQATIAMAGENSQKYVDMIMATSKGIDNEKTINDLQQLIDKIKVKDSALDESKASEMAALLVTDEWRLRIEKAGNAAKNLSADLMAASIEFDKNKAAMKADSSLETLQNRLESQASAFDKGDSALQKYNKNLELLAEYLKKASPEGKKLEQTIKDLNAQILKGDISKLTDKLDEFVNKYNESGNLTPLQKGLHSLNIEYEKMIEVLNGVIAANEKLIAQGEQPVFPTEKAKEYKEALLDAKNNGIKQLEYEHDEFRKKVERIWENMYDNLQDLTAQWLYDWKFDIDSLNDLFKKAVAEMVSAWLWGQTQMQVSGSSGSLSSSLSSLGGAAGVSSAAMASNGSYLPGALSLGNEVLNPGSYAASSAALQSSVSWGLTNMASSVNSLTTSTNMFGNALDSAAFGVSNMSSAAFGGWTAGITTFIAGLLNGKDFGQSAAEGAGAGAGAYAGAQVGAYFGPWGAGIGAILGGMLGALGVGSLFGNNKERAYMYSNYTLDYKSGQGFVQTGKNTPYDRKGGSASFAPAADALTGSLSSALNQLTSMFSSQISMFGKAASNQYETFLKNFSAVAVGSRESSFTSGSTIVGNKPKSSAITIGQYYQAEDAGEAQATVANVVKAFTSGVITPLISGSVGIMRKALQSDFNELDLSVFSNIAKNKIQAALTDALDIMKIGKISDEAGLTKALENIDIAMSGIQAIFDYITQIKELQASWQDIIDKNTMTDAEYQLKQLNKWYEEQTALANSLGMNLGVLNQAYKVQVDQIKATSQSLDVNPMIQLVKDYLDFVNNIQFSDLAPVQSVEQYQNRYNELLGLSRSGDTDATNSLMDFVSSQYLPFLKNFTGDETDYKDLYNELFGPSGTLRNLVVSTSDVLVDGEKIGAGILKAIEPYLIPGEGGINLTIKIGDKTISDLVVSAIRSGDVELISAIGSV